MLKLIVNYNRKVGEPNYGSRGAGVSLECELEAGLLRKPRQLQRTTRRLFVLARRWVEAELGCTSSCKSLPESSGDANLLKIPRETTPSKISCEDGGERSSCARGERLPSSNGQQAELQTVNCNGNHSKPAASSLPITMSQMRALLRLAARRKVSWDRILPEGRKLDQLTRQEASRLIDWLQRLPESHAMSRSHARDDEPALVGADPSDATWSGAFQHGGNGQGKAA